MIRSVAIKLSDKLLNLKNSLGLAIFSVLNSKYGKIKHYGTVYTYSLGSEQQHFDEGTNKISIQSDLPAGYYLFLVRGIHEANNMINQIYNIIFAPDDNDARLYYGFDNPGMNLSCIFKIKNNNCDINLYIDAASAFTTYSIWIVQALRLL